jgi:hypothetical protein
VLDGMALRHGTGSATAGGWDRQRRQIARGGRCGGGLGRLRGASGGGREGEGEFDAAARENFGGPRFGRRED